MHAPSNRSLHPAVMLGQRVVWQQRRHHGSPSRAPHGWFRRALATWPRAPLP